MNLDIFTYVYCITEGDKQRNMCLFSGRTTKSGRESLGQLRTNKLTKKKSKKK